MKLRLKHSFKYLKQKLNNNNVQEILFDLANLVNGKNYFKYEWQEAIERVMWQVAGINPADETYCDCDNYEDSDGMFLVNHDPNYGNYTYDYCDMENNFTPVTESDTLKIINYVQSHLKDIKKSISHMDDSYYKLLIP